MALGSFEASNCMAPQTLNGSHSSEMATSPLGPFVFPSPSLRGVRVQAFRGRVHAPKSWTEEEQGRLYLTNRAVIFDGPTRNVRTTLGQIFKYDWSPNGITIEPQRGAIQRYEFEIPPSFAAALLVIMSSDTIKESPSKPEKRVSEPEPSTRPEPESFDDAVGTDARGVKIYEIE
jgi:hypothetical protein